MYKKDWTFWECVELSTVWTQLHAAYAGSHDGSASSSYCLQWLVVDNEVISVRCTSDYVCGSFLLLYCSFLSVDHHVVVWMLEFVLSLYAHGWPLEPHFWNLNCMNPLCSMLQSHVFMINSQLLMVWLMANVQIDRIIVEFDISIPDIPYVSAALLLSTSLLLIAFPIRYPLQY